MEKWSTLGFFVTSESDILSLDVWLIIDSMFKSTHEGLKKGNLKKKRNVESISLKNWLIFSLLICYNWKLLVVLRKNILKTTGVWLLLTDDINIILLDVFLHLLLQIGFSTTCYQKSPDVPEGIVV